MSDGLGHAAGSPGNRESGPVPLRAAAVYGVVAGLGTYVVVILFLGAHVLTIANATAGGYTTWLR